MPGPKGSQNKITTEKKYEDEPIFIEVFELKKDTDEAENWEDNFEVTSRKKIVPTYE